MNMKWLHILMTVLLVGFTVGCDKEEEAKPTASGLTVEEVSLGNSINANKKVMNPDDEFRPTDTIYASVQTRGTADAAEITAKWTFEDGQTVDEKSQQIAPGGEAVTEFHIYKPDGLPEGQYEVKIMVDGEQVTTRPFKVKA